MSCLEDTTGYVVIYRKSEGVPFENDWRNVSRKDGKLRLNGSLRIPFEGFESFGSHCEVRGYGKDSTGKRFYAWDYQRVSTWYIGFGNEIWLPSCGYFKSSHDRPLDKSGLFLGWGFSWDVGNRNNAFSLSTSHGGAGGYFKFSEPIRLGYRRLFGPPHRIRLGIGGGIKVSVLKLEKDETEFFNSDLRAEAGLSIEGPFERLRYSYTAGTYPYHTLELSMYLISSSNGRIGSRYTFQRADNLWTFRLAVHFESILPDHFPLLMENNRPLPHKILACLGALPYAPLALITWLKE